MFLSITRWRVAPRRWDEAVALFRAEAVPVMEEQPGFFRVLLAGDALDGEGMTVTLWRSEEDALVFARSGASARALQPLAGLFAAPPQTVGYPVVFDREF